jgi:hypothetical protein
MVDDRRETVLPFHRGADFRGDLRRYLNSITNRQQVDEQRLIVQSFNTPRYLNRDPSLSDTARARDRD